MVLYSDLMVILSAMIPFTSVTDEVLVEEVALCTEMAEDVVKRVVAVNVTVVLELQ